MKKKKTKITSLVVLLVFCIFAGCILLVLMTGADVYNRLVQREQTQFDQRTVAQYVTTRLRQGDLAGAVSVETFGGRSTLVIRETIAGNPYETRVYCYDGYVRELFSIADGDFEPVDGEKVLEAEALDFWLEQSVLRVRIVLCDGTEQELCLYLRSGEEAA